MKKTITLAAMVLALTLMISNQSYAQGFGAGTGVCDIDNPNFVDEDGDGFNDLAPDADGDGIPNYADEDYVRPLDGTGVNAGQGQGGNRSGARDGSGNHWGRNFTAPVEDAPVEIPETQVLTKIVKRVK